MMPDQNLSTIPLHTPLADLQHRRDRLRFDIAAWILMGIGLSTILYVWLLTRPLPGPFFVHILVGMMLGGMVAISTTGEPAKLGPLTRALQDRIRFLATAFRRVVFAQVRISALNTILTALYLGVLLPLMGIELPLTKTMIAVTFVAGLIPVLGNLISNTVIVIVSLSSSLYAAIGSLVFLVFIHKLEYFVNARIIGSQIRARAWELLLAMLVMESA